MTARLRMLLARDPKILVVDDQDANLRLVGTVLTQAGFEVLPARNGEQALQRAQVTPPDLVLLDMMMPGMDGFEVANALRANPATSAVPVIFLTAAHERENLVRAFESGAVDFVTKPFVSEELLARVRTHLELKLARDHLKRIADEREELATLVAHDLKNPLSSILFSAQLLNRGSDDAAKTLRLARLIETSAGDALAFIQRYLERRAEGELIRRFKEEPIALDAVLQRMSERFLVQAQAKRIKVTIDCPEVLHALADSAALAHVTENLISNAIKFSPPDTEITLKCGRGSPGTIRVMVMDRGPGVSADDQRRLFRRFVRLGPKPTGNESSTGLGLALAKQDIAQMRGELWYEDRADGGSVFAFELPAAPEVA